MQHAINNCKKFLGKYPIWKYYMTISSMYFIGMNLCVSIGYVRSFCNRNSSILTDNTYIINVREMLTNNMCKHIIFSLVWPATTLTYIIPNTTLYAYKLLHD